MIGLASPLHRSRLRGIDFDDAVEDLLVRHDLERGQDAASGAPGSASLDLREVSSAAVDPFEIAAALEAVGVHQRTVRSQFGRDDVFELAAHMFDRIPLRPVAAPRRQRPAAGGPRDLLRGAVFAVPGLAFTDVLRGAGVAVAWWTLPLALTLGWSLGQAVAVLGHMLRNRQDPVGGRVVNGRILLVSGVVAGAATTACVAWLGGGPADLVVGLGFVVFMVSSGVLLLHEEERVLAWAIVPAVVAYGAVAAGGAAHRYAVAALVCEGAAVVVVLVAACRHATVRIWRPTRLLSADLPDTLRHLVHGACCGAMVSSVLLLALGTGDVGAVREPVTWPLLLTLGVMEWQLRSFRAAVHRLRATLCSLERFASTARRALRRSIGLYTASIVVASAGVAVLLMLTHRPVAYRPLVVQALLGVLLCTDLLVLVSGGIRSVLRCWLVGALAGAATLIVFAHRATPVDLDHAWVAALVTVVVISCALLLTARRVVRSPLT